MQEDHGYPRAARIPIVDPRTGHSDQSIAHLPADNISTPQENNQEAEKPG